MNIEIIVAKTSDVGLIQLDAQFISDVRGQRAIGAPAKKADLVCWDWCFGHPASREFLPPLSRMSTCVRHDVVTLPHLIRLSKEQECDSSDRQCRAEYGLPADLFLIQEITDRQNDHRWQGHEHGVSILIDTAMKSPLAYMLYDIFCFDRPGKTYSLVFNSRSMNLVED